MLLNPREQATLIDGQCSKCERHKPRKSNDCSIYRALFVTMSPTAVQNAHKIFDENGVCKSFKRKEEGK